MVMVLVYGVEGQIENGLTAIDDLAEEVATAMEVLGGTVPAAVLELVLALGDGLFGALGHGHHDARMVAHQTTLLAAQRRVHVRLQVRVGDRVLFDRIRHQVGRLAGPRDSPVHRHGTRLAWMANEKVHRIK